MLKAGTTVLEYTDDDGQTIAWVTCRKHCRHLNLQDISRAWYDSVTDKSAKFAGCRVWATTRAVKLINGKSNKLIYTIHNNMILL